MKKVLYWFLLSFGWAFVAFSAYLVVAYRVPMVVVVSGIPALIGVALFLVATRIERRGLEPDGR